LFPGNNCLFERNVVIKIERAWTIGKKLPQDAINPAHGSLLGWEWFYFEGLNYDGLFLC
jgi:hypothetical protein